MSILIAEQKDVVKMENVYEKELSLCVDVFLELKEMLILNVTLVSTYQLYAYPYSPCKNAHCARKGQIKGTLDFDYFINVKSVSTQLFPSLHVNTII